MNSSSATDYWITVLRQTTLRKENKINHFFSSLQDQWLGGLKLTDDFRDNPQRFVRLLSCTIICQRELPFPLTNLPVSILYLHLEIPYRGVLHELPPNLLELTFHGNYELIDMDEDIWVVSEARVELTSASLPSSLRILRLFNQDFPRELSLPQLEELYLDCDCKHHYFEIPSHPSLKLRLLPSTLKVLQLGYYYKFKKADTLARFLDLRKLYITRQLHISSWRVLPANLRELYIRWDGKYRANLYELPRNLELFYALEIDLLESELAGLPPRLHYVQMCRRTDGLQNVFFTEEEESNVLQGVTTRYHSSQAACELIPGEFATLGELIEYKGKAPDQEEYSSGDTFSSSEE